MSLKHLTPLDREYYDSVRHANSDATTPGFFKVPDPPYGFFHRLGMEDETDPAPHQPPNQQKRGDAR